MSVPNFPIKGFHGDGDPDIELHHSQPSYWTGRQTAWSLGLVIVFIAVSYLLVKLLG